MHPYFRKIKGLMITKRIFFKEESLINFLQETYWMEFLSILRQPSMKF